MLYNKKVTSTENTQENANPCHGGVSDKISIFIHCVNQFFERKFSINHIILSLLLEKCVSKSRSLKELSSTEYSMRDPNVTRPELLRFAQQKVFVGSFCLIQTVPMPCDISGHQVSIDGQLSMISWVLKKSLYTE